MRALLAALLLLVSACTAEPGVVSAEQAEVLAQVRSRGYEEGGAAFVANASGGVRMEGVVDWRTHTATATLQDRTRLAWTLRSLAVSRGAAWQVRALAPDAEPMDRLLLMVLNLASDRPENPQLLRRNQAHWMRSDTRDGIAVDVYRGPRPGHTFYWVSADGLLRRFEAELTVLDFSGFGRKSVILPSLLQGRNP